MFYFETRMNRKPYTGGPLNWLKGKAGISAPARSVPVSRLVKTHQPKSAAELEQLIANHIGGGCPCGESGNRGGFRS